MKMIARTLLVSLSAICLAVAEITNSDGVIPQTIADAVHEFFAPGLHDRHDVQTHMKDKIGDEDDGTVMAGDEMNNQTMVDHHALFNEALAEDEERVHAGGEVKIRKKRFLCKKCFPSYSYGYGGGGGCCGSCGSCGPRPVRIRVPVAVAVPVPVYSGYSGGCGSCYRPPPRPAYNPCGVCGR